MAARKALRRPAPALTEAEADAVILGLCLVLEREATTDEDDTAEGLGPAAEAALAKIGALMPPPIEEKLDPEVKPRQAIERAIRTETKLALRYGDRQGALTSRIVWPLEIGFYEVAEVLIAWCETRRDFRHFRLDRMVAVTGTAERYAVRQRILLARWQSRAEEWA